MGCAVAFGDKMFTPPARNPVRPFTRAVLNGFVDLHGVSMIENGQLWKHFKGGLYRTRGVA